MQLQRKLRTRGRLKAKSALPRLSVFRSNTMLYAQVIDDMVGKTLASAKGKKGEEVGRAIAEAAKKAKVTKVKFDRGSYAYHGRVKSVAEAAREGGLEF